MKILIIHKEPIIERIPNLKAFIVYASLHNHEITILTTKNKIYPEPTFLTKNINYIAIQERNRKFQLPTIIRFYSICLLYILKKIFQNYSLILAGRYALIFGTLINTIKLKRFNSFIIEYPKLCINDGKQLSFVDKLEITGIRKSKFIITHDELHAKFIAQQLHIKNLKFLTIPNGTIGKACKNDSKFLHERLHIDKRSKILLHSGGFGPWFDSKLLSKESKRLSSEYELVFHVSHNIKNDDYYQEYIRNKEVGDRTLFSLEPVPTDKLDELVLSSQIGIAWYSTDVLGYRATMLGLAAGKIGNYLKCGIPVIVPDFDSFNYISEFSCGKKISNLEDLNDAITEIDKNYIIYSENAMKCYNELWNTKKYCEKLLIELES